MVGVISSHGSFSNPYMFLGIELCYDINQLIDKENRKWTQKFKWFITCVLATGMEEKSFYYLGKYIIQITKVEQGLEFNIVPF